MEDDHTQQASPAFHQIQMRMSGQHHYPHSHHGTPATEYAGFVWPSPQADDTVNYGHSPVPRPNHQSLHPLVMPQWPSMLSSQPSRTAPNHYPNGLPQVQMGTVSPTPLMTPVSASSNRSGSTPRRTLTDDERRKMCEYHEQNPSAKQNEIGTMFGVERSTVSKVLRQKEKYLQKQTEAIRSPERRLKGKSPDIEKTLSNWVIKEQKKGTLLSDEAIRDKAEYFSSVSGPEHAASNPANNATWLKNFKRRHNLAGRKPSKDGTASNDKRTSSKASLRHRSSEEVSPASTKEETSPSPNKLREVCSDESLNVENSDGFDLTTTLSATSLPAGFTDTPASSFSADALLSPTSPFFTSGPSTLSFYRHCELTDEPLGESSFQRPRSQTFPMIYQEMQAESPTDTTRFLNANLDEIGHSLSSIDEAMDDSSSGDIDMDLTRPQTVSPLQMMHPPPLPASAMSTRNGSQSGSLNSSTETRLESALVASLSRKGGAPPSQEEARLALRVVWQYFSSQPRGTDENLDMEEIAMMGKFMEKLKARNKDRG